jgi:hypothetical protein
MHAQDIGQRSLAFLMDISRYKKSNDAHLAEVR